MICAFVLSTHWVTSGGVAVLIICACRMASYVYCASSAGGMFLKFSLNRICGIGGVPG